LRAVWTGEIMSKLQVSDYVRLAGRIPENQSDEFTRKRDSFSWIGVFGVGQLAKRLNTLLNSARLGLGTLANA